MTSARYFVTAVSLCIVNTVIFARPVDAQSTGPEVGSCEEGSAEAFLDIGNVRAKIGIGRLFYARGRSDYEVPNGSGIHALHSASLWVGGLIDGELRSAGSTYGPREYWPGPLGEDGWAPDDCAAFDRFWAIDYEKDIAGSQQGTPTEAVLEWPAEFGAPFHDENGLPGYQPGEGDRPTVYGDRMLWWIMNDRGNEHAWGQSLPLGLEVRVAAYAYDVGGIVGNTTFYRYGITNRNQHDLLDAFVGIFIDPDLGGYPFDDRIGTDSTLGMVYAYNGDNVDEDWTIGPGYGDNPPAIGMSVIDLSHAPDPNADRNDPAVFPGFNHTMHYFGGGGPMGNPNSAEQFHRLLQANWVDGVPLTENGNGRESGGRKTDYVYAGDPVTEALWSELNVDGAGTESEPFDRRMIGSVGPIDLPSGEELSFTVVIVWSRGSDHLDSISQLREDMAVVRESAGVFTAPTGVSVSTDPTPDAEVSYTASIYPNPAVDQATLRLGIPQPTEVRIDVFDALGRSVHDVVDARLDPGDRTWTLPTADWPPGVYLIRIQLDHNTEVRRLVVAR